MQTRKKLKPFVIPVIYSIVTITMLISLMFLIQNLLNVNKNPLTYITSGTIAEDIVPVVSEKKTIIRPYTDQDVKIVQNFYDYKGEKQNQENSLIFYENTYLQNSGVDYGKGSTFDVVAILEGTVIKVKQDDILGKIVEIRHSNDLIGSYQCLGETGLKENDTVSQGQKIGTSGSCNISKNLGDHLHFEITSKGEVINPEAIYDKQLNEI